MIGEKIKQFRLALGLTQEQLAERVGYKSKSTINKIEQGVNDIPLTKMEEFAAVLGVATSDLMGWTPSNILTPSAHAIPILGTICAGDGIVAEQSYEGKFFIDSSIQADYCLLVKGDSMIGAEIYDGDYAFLRKALEFRSGQIYAVLLAGTNEATLKKVHQQGESTLILSPCNDAYDPIISDTTDCLLIGELVGVYHSHEK